MKQFWSKTSTLIITAIFCCTLWGSAYPCIKVGYRLFSIASGDVPGQLFFAGCRFALAGILVILAGSLLQKKLLLPEKSDWKPIATLALFQTILQYIFFYMGLARASAVRSSIINGTGAFVAILLAVYMFRLEKMTLKKFIGCFLGFSGVLLVETIGQTVNFGFAWNGEGFILLSVFASSMASILIKIFSRDHNPVLLSGWQFFTGGLTMAIVAFLFGGQITVGTPTSLLLLLYMAFISSAAYTLWGVLLKYHPVSHVTVFNFVTPVAGVLLSSVILSEHGVLNGSVLIALVLVCGGILVVSRE